MVAVLVFLARRLKRPDEALEAARRGLHICRVIRTRNQQWKMNVVESLLGLAVALLGKKRLSAAERTFRQASRMVSESAHPHQASLALNGIAGLRLARGDLKGAQTYLLRALRLKERAGDLHQLAIAYSNLAEVELRLSEIHPAVEHARRSVQLGEQARQAMTSRTCTRTSRTPSSPQATCTMRLTPAQRLWRSPATRAKYISRKSRPSWPASARRRQRRRRRAPVCISQRKTWRGRSPGCWNACRRMRSSAKNPQNGGHDLIP